jgi:SAM-dependent methyltransferase
VVQADNGAGGRALQLESVLCAICGIDDAEPLAVGEDFEYRTSPDSYLAVQCRRCDLVYLDRRPVASEVDRIYPPDYHAFDFSPERYGLGHRARGLLERRRLSRATKGLGSGARIVDIGCGDGFHLDLLRALNPSWALSGVEPDPRAAARARERGFVVHESRIEDADLPEGSVDLAITIQTIEHVADPVGLAAAAGRVLKPSGRLVVVTDNTASLDFALFKGRHWGGYHFPRHWNLFNNRSMRALADRAGLRVEELTTAVSPVNWTYSVRNLLDDWGAPNRLVRSFALDRPAALAVFTVFDAVNQVVGRGALLRAVMAPEGPA